MRANAYRKARVGATWVLALLAPLCCLVSAFGQLEHDLVAEDDEVFITVIEPVVIDVLSNDIDNLAHNLTITQVTSAAFGTVSIDHGAQSITYTPGESFVEEDIFTYEVSDGEITAFASVTVTLGVPSAPRSTKGTYDGLIEGLEGPIGFIRIALATGDADSRFTGSARLTGRTIRFRGTLAAGAAVVPLPGGGRVDLTLRSELGFNTIIGDISVGAVVGNFTASQFTYSPQIPAPQTGKYTLVADADPTTFPVPEFPQGATWAKVAITKAGLLRIRGRLGDGKVLSTSAVVRATSANLSGEAAMFVTPYARRSGTFSGVLTFAETENPQNPDFEGAIQWIRPPSAKGPYASGFSLNVSLIGARFNTTRGTSVLAWGATNNQGQAYTDDGNQPNDVLKKLVTLAGLNKIQVDDPGADRLRIVVRADGLVTGSFVIEGQQKPTRITGIVLQKFGDIIEGQFPGRGPTRAADQVGWFGIFPGRDNNPELPQRAALQTAANPAPDPAL